MRFLGLILFFSCLFLWGQTAQAWETYIARSMTLYVRSLEKGNVILANSEPDGSGTPMLISLYGIGIPTPKQPFGQNARDFLMRLLPPGSKIIASTVKENDNGVISALVQHNDRSVNSRLVDEGLAWVDRSSCKAFFCRGWHIGEQLAVKERRGVWSMPSTKAPWQWSD